MIADRGDLSRTPGESAEGASIVALRRDSVLLVKRGRGLFAGLWSFPGGRIDPGETAEAAARRELAEETGLTLGALASLGLFRPAAEHSALVIEVFAGRASAGEPVAGDDASEARFVPFERVLSLSTTPGAARWIGRAIRALAV